MATNDKIKIFKFSEKQKLIYNDLFNSSINILLLEGAVRSGKSYTRNFLRLKFIKTLPKGASILVSGRTSGTRKQNILSEWERLLGNITFLRRNDRAGEYYLIPIKGFEKKKIYVRGSYTQEDYKKIQGMTLDFWYGDEVTHSHKSFFDMALSRLSKRHSKCILTCNPGSPHHFLKTDFIDAIEKDPLKATYFRNYKFLFQDNPSLTNRYKRRLSNALKGVSNDRYIKGLWILADGLIYNNFKKELHTKIFSEEELIELKKTGQIFIRCDYGTLNATAFLKIIKKDNKYYLIQEYYHSGRDTNTQKTTSEYVAEMIKFIGDDIIKAIIIDPSASPFIADLVKNGLKKILKANNEVLPGIRKVQNDFIDDNVIISKKCINTIAELEVYSWDEKRSLKGEDIPKKEKDHRMDALRYGIFSTNFNQNLGKNNGYY